MPPRDANIRHMLQELEDLGRNLTDWEQSFLESASDDFERTGRLTDKQYEKLTQIYEARVQ